MFVFFKVATANNFGGVWAVLLAPALESPVNSLVLARGLHTAGRGSFK